MFYVCTELLSLQEIHCLNGGKRKIPKIKTKEKKNKNENNILYYI